MSLVQKISPINEDVVIATIQTHLYNNLLAKGITRYESYERIYVNNGSPEVYLKNGQYKEVFYDSNFYLTSFFVLGEAKTFNENEDITADLSIIFQANLTKLFTSITHRPDAELHSYILQSLSGIPANFKIKELITGIDNVYNGFEFKNEQYLDDISNSHLCRVNLEIQYINQKCKQTI